MECHMWKMGGVIMIELIDVYVNQNGDFKYSENRGMLIRCKDCKYCSSGIDEDGDQFLKCYGWVYGGISANDYCSHAERKSYD